MRFLLLAALLSHTALAESLKFSEMKGWRTVDVEKDAFLQAMFQDTQYLILVENPQAEEKPTLRVVPMGDAARLDRAKAESWSRVLVNNKQLSQTISAQRVVKAGETHRYFAEFKSHTGTGSPLYSIVLGVVVNGQVYGVYYDQRQGVYEKNIESIKKLLQTIRIESAKP